MHKNSTKNESSKAQHPPGVKATLMNGQKKQGSMVARPRRSRHNNGCGFSAWQPPSIKVEKKNKLAKHKKYNNNYPFISIYSLDSKGKF
jgi:hypothetical protein